MSARRCLVSVAALCLPLLLSGCFVLSTTRKLPIPRAPGSIQTVTPEELVAQMNQRWEKLQTLNASVEIQASVLKSKEGVARDYTTFRGIILLRKPEMLRVYGRVPVVGTTMFDMASDGRNFTLYIPSKSLAIKGSNALKKKSESQIENMRPGFFFDAVVVKGLDAEDDYSVVQDLETVEDATRKHLLITPEYVLSIVRPKAESHEQTPVRTITFHRDDLLPYEQDVYDSEGNPETQVYYSNYRDFGFGPYPSRIVIKRPQEEYQIVMTVEKVTENIPLTDDQFVVRVPEGNKVQQLE
jgi:outer membrane lipoprotein-sorting protein